MKKVIVVGAGASGIFAAGEAAYAGADVILLEKKNQPGKKILISGKGRCNITNNSEVADFIKHFNRNGRFLHQAFARFFAPQLMDFFIDQGMPVVTERGDRVFPASGKATDVLNTLLHWLNTSGAKLKCSKSVTGLFIENNRIKGVKCGTTILYADAVILATGGSSYPATGSTGDGYNFAESAGHTLTPLRPALVPLISPERTLGQLAGLDLRNAGVRIYVNGKRKKIDFGEVGFTRSGLGGPVTLTHSLFIIDSIRAGKKVTISLDLKPALNEQKLDARLLRDFQARNKEELQSVLRGLLPQKLVAVCLHHTQLDGNKPAGEMSSKERNRLRTWLKDFRFEISGHKSLREAIVTAGGVQVKEVDPNTMESKLVDGLYFTGELLDIDADTGGYNLQAAFSTGWVAGRAAAE